MKMNLNKQLLGVLLVVLLGSCASPKNIIYMQDVEPFRQGNIEQIYEPIIHEDDLLAIMVNSRDPELALPFNMPMVTYQLGTNNGTTGQQRVLGYLVDRYGDVDFPILGKIRASGLSRMQLTELIKKRLVDEDLIKDPIVTVQFLNFKVSVIGEVSRPGSFTVSGDLTIYGRRDRVAVIRENNGKRTILFHDLRSADIFDSPCYYLQQNDIVYVEPNKAKAGQSGINQNNTVGVWVSVVSLLTTVAVLIFK